MESKIIFLGTGGDSIIVGKQIRASGGIILQVDDNQFHIDPGPGSLLQAKNFGVNLRNNTAVFATHNHVNHCNDINAVIDAMTYGGMDRKGVAVCNKIVCNGNDDYTPTLSKFHRNCVEKTIVLEQGQRLGINDVEIRALSAVHSEPHTIGLKFFTSKFTLTYTSDTGYDKTLAHEYKDSDIIIFNLQFPGNMGKTHYLCTEDVIKILKDVKPKLVIIQHFGVKMMNEDPLNEAREIQKATKIQTIAATDGMVINPSSYAGMRKKNLKQY
ncbi:MBL fold metallo-hydrolase [Candidatus Woesearchaeota archaeon]|nr:MBL fold metallo-hydrolase [Candidatus Woesearchaeota archaeon]